MQRPQNPDPSEDFGLRETAPRLGRGGRATERLISTYDLVEQMQYLYVRVVKARGLQENDAARSIDPYVVVKLGNYKGTSRHFEEERNPEWNQVFAFSKERIQASGVDVLVKDKYLLKDDFVGKVSFNLNEIPQRFPPDSSLAPQWYRLSDRNGNEDKVKGELMLAVWMGSQADEVFPEAWHSDAAGVSGDGVASIRSKVYLSPKLWYLRVNVIEAQDLHLSESRERGRFPEVYVKAFLGNNALRAKVSLSRNANPLWNKDLMFVAAEPFEEHLVLSVEDRIAANKDEVLGKCVISLQAIQKRLDNKAVNTKWYNLEKHVVVVDEDKKEKVKFASKIHLRICLEGGYHVLDESTQYCSDLRPTAKALWKPSIGVLELGILTASGLIPMKNKDGRATTDAYCVAKYGQKWVRTRTIIDSLTPRWNEQYTWEVYDPCTVITIGVFDNCHLQGGGDKDNTIGKVRIRLSALETDKLYTHTYPLLVLQKSGVKKMGEIQLAVRFTCLSLLNMMHIYSQPMLPKMHYLHDVSGVQLDNLRRQAIQMVSMRLSRAEPALRKEIVEYMLDVDIHFWNMRRSRANFSRIFGVLNGLFAITKWFNLIRSWKNPIFTVLTHIAFLTLVFFPGMILPLFFFYLFIIGIWNYRWRPRQPPHMDTRLSCADNAHPDELDEEFDTYPTSGSQDKVKQRYDRLRIYAARIQIVVGDFATQAERLQSLLSWRDPRATAIFVMFCLIAAALLFVTPLQVVVLFIGFYLLRHPKFRHRLPSAPINYLRRLPARTDSML
ncbi:hypothetical protein GIB67_040245 [Kingdonia uniflora]|uniref:C2 domain-containing protein n=1 Tax=Kingdonia uniflora TaxID=39325 RepID=A0A7J7MUX2_9MAGN|nr:hypothetical protein GIB67_040245 [Kingdonia uniflora]